MYSRKVQGRELTFRFNHNLYKANLLLDDVETGSVWSQLKQQAIEGPLKGEQLEPVPSLQTTWAHWRSLHPDTLVVEPGEGRGSRPPYGLYESVAGTDADQSQTVPSAEEQVVLGLSIAGKSKAYPFAVLAKSDSPVRDQLGSVPLLIHFRSEVPAAWATDETGELLPAVTTLRAAWMSFHPDSEVFSVGSDPTPG